MWVGQGREELRKEMNVWKVKDVMKGILRRLCIGMYVYSVNLGRRKNGMTSILTKDIKRKMA